jgi:hypothetical protein
MVQLEAPVEHRLPAGRHIHLEQRRLDFVPAFEALVRRAQRCRGEVQRAEGHGLPGGNATCPFALPKKGKGRKQALLFVNKKRAARPASKKTLLFSVPGCFTTARSGAKKFFGYFFSKK